MKSESTVKPPKFNIEKCGDTAEIVLSENITEIKGGNGTTFIYDEYRINSPYRENLVESIEKHFDRWLSMAKDKERESAYKPTQQERLEALEMAMIDIILGGAL